MVLNGSSFVSGSRARKSYFSSGPYLVLPNIPIYTFLV